MGIVPTERQDDVAKNIEQARELRAFDREISFEPLANFECGSLWIDAPLGEGGKIISQEIGCRFSPATNFGGARF